jgi:hypothetical protein
VRPWSGAPRRERARALGSVSPPAMPARRTSRSRRANRSATRSRRAGAGPNNNAVAVSNANSAAPVAKRPRLTMSGRLDPSEQRADGCRVTAADEDAAAAIEDLLERSEELAKQANDLRDRNEHAFRDAAGRYNRLGRRIDAASGKAKEAAGYIADNMGEGTF